MPDSPLSRTLAALRARGYQADKVEQTVPHTFIKRDAFGFGDILACGDGKILLAQATTSDHVQERLEKIRTECRVKALGWLRSGGLIQVWGWRRLKFYRGSKAVRWEPRVVEVTMEYMQETVQIHKTGVFNEGRHET